MTIEFDDLEVGMVFYAHRTNTRWRVDLILSSSCMIEEFNTGQGDRGFLKIERDFWPWTRTNLLLVLSPSAEKAKKYLDELIKL